MLKKQLNLDIPGSITEFESLMKDFVLKHQLYKILFRGKGLEFDSYRDYAPDDDSQDIDWRASVRTNKLLVKRYIEERDMKIMILIDVSDNMLMGSTEKIKCEYTAEMAASLAHLILGSGDNVGFAFFNDSIVRIVLPQKGNRQFDLIVDDLLNPDFYGGKSNPEKALLALASYLDASVAAVILISVFIKIRKSAQKVFETFSSRFETMAIIVRDPLDFSMPNIRGELLIEDPETGEQMIVDPSVARKMYEKNALAQQKLITGMMEDEGIDFVQLSTKESFAPQLAVFLQERAEKGKYITAR
jgi:uncharacterized protein (DUF58 family)